MLKTAIGRPSRSRNFRVPGGNSSTGTGAVVVNNGAVLGGTGAVGGTAGDVTMNAGATLNPGTVSPANTGTLTALRSVTLNGGTGSNWIVGISSGTAGSAANLLALNNAAGLLNFVTSGGTYNIDFEAVGTPTFTQFQPLTYTIGTVTTAGNIQLNGSPFPTTPTTAGFTFSSSTIDFGAGSASLMASGTNLLLTFTPVPEPAHALLACGAAAGAAGWWRRRQT